MTRLAYQRLIERQRQSGLSIREFCVNESYSLSSFHFWKRKFGVRSGTHSADFAPVSFPVLQQQVTPEMAESRPKGDDGIIVELPDGIRIHFRGVTGTRAAIQLITQMTTGHVLPE